MCFHFGEPPVLMSANFPNAASSAVVPVLGLQSSTKPFSTEASMRWSLDSAGQTTWPKFRRSSANSRRPGRGFSSSSTSWQGKGAGGPSFMRGASKSQATMVVQPLFGMLA